MGNNFMDGLKNSAEFKQLLAQGTSITGENSIYAMDATKQKEVLKKLFVQASDNNISVAEKAQMMKDAENLKAKIERLEAKMAVLAEMLEENEDKINKTAKTITNMMIDIERESGAHVDTVEDVTDAIVKDAMDMWKQHVANPEKYYPTLTPTKLSSYISSSVADNYQIKQSGVKLDALITKLNAKQGEVDALTDKITGFITQKNVLEKQYGVTKATYDMLAANINQVGDNEASYINTDYTSEKPIYSPAKLAVVAAFFENDPQVCNGNCNVLADNTAKEEGTTQPTFNSILADEKYKGCFGVAAGGDDKYSSQNPAVVALGKAIDNGLFQDLVSTGETPDKIAKFFADNFSGAKISLNSKGVLNVPKGHPNRDKKSIKVNDKDCTSRQVYNMVSNFFANYGSGPVGAKDTWSDAGNTVGTNPQLAAMLGTDVDNFENSNISKIIDAMTGAGCNPPFTFKEGMYALFGPNGLFKNCGVRYNLNDQTKGKPEYYIEFAGDQDTADLYKAMADKIYDAWGVGPSWLADVDRYGDDEEIPVTGSVPISISHIDPLTFKDDLGAEYTFILDKNKDGKFDIVFENGELKVNEFLGGNDNWQDELKSIDTDGDGKISAQEAEEGGLKVVKTSFKDNAYQAGVQGLNTKKRDDKFLRVERTDLEYSMHSLENLGIKELDFSTSVNNQRQIDVNGQEKTDINGSQVFDDSFKVVFGTQHAAFGSNEVTASRKDDEASYLEAVYGAMGGKGFEIGLSSTEADEILNNAYGKMDGFDSKYGETFKDMNTLLNFDKIKKAASEMVDEAKEDAKDYQDTEVIKAQRRVLAFNADNSVSGWSNELIKEVLNALQALGVAVPDIASALGHNSSSSGDAIKGEYTNPMIQQLFGIYQQGFTTPQAIAEEYKRVADKEAEYDAKRENKIATGLISRSLIECLRNGMSVSLAKVKEILTQNPNITTPLAFLEYVKDENNKVPYEDVTVKTSLEVLTTHADDKNAFALDKDREDDIIKAFIFKFGDNAPEALAILSAKALENPNFMIGKNGYDLADFVLVNGGEKYLDMQLLGGWTPELEQMYNLEYEQNEHFNKIDDPNYRPSHYIPDDDMNEEPAAPPELLGTYKDRDYFQEAWTKNQNPTPTDPNPEEPTPTPDDVVPPAPAPIPDMSEVEIEDEDVVLDDNPFGDNTPAPAPTPEVDGDDDVFGDILPDENPDIDGLPDFGDDVPEVDDGVPFLPEDDEDEIKKELDIE